MIIETGYFIGGLLAGIITSVIVICPIAMRKARYEMKGEIDNLNNIHNQLRKELDLSRSRQEGDLSKWLGYINVADTNKEEILRLQREISRRDEIISCVSSRVIEIIENEKLTRELENIDANDNTNIRL